MGAYRSSAWASLTFLVTLSGTLGSSGDRQPTYRRCVATCVATAGCVQAEPATQVPCQVKVCDASVQGAVVTALWGCEDECRYQCMWEAEKLAAGKHTGAQKYHGKWPFQRVCGLQEVASVVASVGNLAAHVDGFLSLNSAHLKTGRSYAFMNLWVIYFAVSCAAWVCSSLFHSRDTTTTERLDYAAANAAIAVGAWASLVRCAVGLRGAWVSGVACFAGWACHVLYMNAVKFDYGWNMCLCVCVGVAQSGLWARWVTITNHPGKLTLWLFLVTVNLAMLLEVRHPPSRCLFPWIQGNGECSYAWMWVSCPDVWRLLPVKLLDFSPLWRILDAHAVWHLTTVPLVSLWYSFLRADVAWETTRETVVEVASRKMKQRTS